MRKIDIYTDSEEIVHLEGGLGCACGCREGAAGAANGNFRFLAKSLTDCFCSGTEGDFSG